MFCVSDRLYPSPYHRQLQQPVTVVIPSSYDREQQQQAAFTTMMMMSMLPGPGDPARSLMMMNAANFHRQTVPVLPLRTGEYLLRETPSPPTCEDGVLTPPRQGKLETEFRVASRRRQRQQVRRGRTTTGVVCAADPCGTTTSFRIADILGWSVAGSVPGHDSVSCTKMTKASPATTTTTIVRPWDECSSVSSTCVSEVMEERSAVDDDDKATTEDIDVDDASCSPPSGITSSDSRDLHDVCPLGALLRMTTQTNFDECANRLQECFSNGRYIGLCHKLMCRLIILCCSHWQYSI